MSDEAASYEETTDPQPQIDPARLEQALDRARAEQNLVGGLLAGLAAAVLGAGLWAVITVVTHYQISWMAVGVGFLVGFAVRLVGKGIDQAFGIVGAVLALLSCLAGNLLAVCGLLANQEGAAFLDVVSQLSPTLIQEIMVATFSPMDLLFYGIAIYLGYKLSFRRLSQEDLGL